MSAALDSRLVQMANQIAANLAAHGDDRAAEETAQHIIDYWDPSMKQAILAADQSQLSNIARAAVERIAVR